MLEEKPDHTLQTTALVNEALIRLLEGAKISWESRRHFYALVARRMRQVLTDHARTQLAAKRGGGAEHLPVEDAIVLSPDGVEELVMLDEALTRLAEADERKAKVVEYKYLEDYNLKKQQSFWTFQPLLSNASGKARARG